MIWCHFMQSRTFFFLSVGDLVLVSVVGNLWPKVRKEVVPHWVTAVCCKWGSMEGFGTCFWSFCRVLLSILLFHSDLGNCRHSFWLATWLYDGPDNWNLSHERIMKIMKIQTNLWRYVFLNLVLNEGQMTPGFPFLTIVPRSLRQIFLEVQTWLKIIKKCIAGHLFSLDSGLSVICDMSHTWYRGNKHYKDIRAPVEMSGFRKQYSNKGRELKWGSEG